MRGVKLLVLFLFISFNFDIPSSMAYEGDVHYAWTYYLALQVGFSERQAYQIASAAGAIDWDPETNPVSSPLDIKIDVLFGAERFRYFDRDLHEKWKNLNTKLKDSTLYTVDETPASFMSMNNALKKTDSDTTDNMLNGAWKEYYDALVLRNPAVRTFTQFHAFQPLTLQKHGNPEFNGVPDLTLNVDEKRFLSLNSPLANFRVKKAKWEDSWFEYLFLDNSSMSWVAMNLMEQPASDKNPPSSKLDSDTFALFKETIDFCSTKSIRECLCEDYNTAVRTLVNLDAHLESYRIKHSLRLKTQEIECGENKLSIEYLQNLYTEINRMIRDAEEIVGKQYRDEAGGIIKRNKLAEIVNGFLRPLRADGFIDLIASDSNYLSHVRVWQEHTGMSWPLVYSSLLRDVESYVLNEYWNPTEPKDLKKSHAPTFAVNAVRGNVARELWRLAVNDGNPGPMIHYSQDIPSHGAFNTYNGHALTNHAPDFISQSLKNAETATYDTLAILCNFKNQLDKKNKASFEKPSEGFFSGQRTGTAGFCKSKGIKSFIHEKSLSVDPAKKGAKLKDILEGLSEMSDPPSMQNSRVTFQLLEKTGAFTPSHYLNVDNDTTIFTNSFLGLPEYAAAVEFLGRKVETDLIPVWRDNKLRIEDVFQLKDQATAYYKFKDRMNWIEKEYSSELSPIGIPKKFIQYDFDYCGRVMDGDMNWPDSGPSHNLKACSEPVFMNGKDPKETEVDKNTREIYPVENIQIIIEDMSIEGAKGFGMYTTLKYNVSGHLTGLSSGGEANMTIPKTVVSNIGGDSTDMFTRASVIEHGPIQFPIFKTCQLLMVNSEKIEKEMNSIVEGTFENGDREKATEQVYGYMFGPENLSNVTTLYSLEGLFYKENLESNSHSPKDFIAMNDDLKKDIANSDSIFMACSVQAQGLPPVVALKKVSREVQVDIKFNPGRK